MRVKLKLLGMEVLYSLIGTAIALIAYTMQQVGREHIGNHSSFIFAGEDYQYHPIAYLTGIVVFVGTLAFLYRFLLREKTDLLKEKGIALKLIWVVIALFFALAQLLGLAATAFMILGFGDNMTPDWLFLLTHFGWPIGYFGFMTGIMIMKVRDQRKFRTENISMCTEGQNG